MKIWITIVRNKEAEPDISDFLGLLHKEGFDPQVSVYETNFDLSYKEFTPGKWGLDGIKSRVREIVPREANNIVLFFYKPNRQVHAWTYPNPLTSGDVFCEIPWSEDWEQWTSEAAIHESIHAFHRILWWQGIGSRDTMDNFDTNLGGLEENLTRLRPYYKKFPTPHAVLSAMGQIVALAGYITSLLGRLITGHSNVSVELPGGLETPGKPVEPKEEPIPGNKLEAWASAIKEFEGWYPGSRSYRQNNPGNLRYSPFQAGTKDNFAYFTSYEDGWAALLHQLRIAANGTSGVYNPEMTLLEFFKKYAPSSDNNHPENYARFVAEKVGVKVDKKIKYLV